MAYCHFELCRDFSEWLTDIRRLLVAAVVFLYQITVFLQQNTTSSLLELYFNDSMQTVYGTLAVAAAVAVDKQRLPMGRCSIYRHRYIHIIKLSQFTK